MPTEYPVEQWITELGRHYSIEQLRLNEQGILALAIGDGLSVHMQAIAASETLVFYASVVVMSDPLPPDLLVSMLQANRFWHETGGATLSLDDQTPPRVILAQSVRFQDIDTSRLIEAFENFAGALQAMHEWLAPEVKTERTQADSPAFMQRA